LPKKKRTDRDAEKRRLAFHAGQQRLARRRTIIGILGFVPLGASVACGLGPPFDLLCAVPRELWLLIWAALFGSFLGLTIRLIRERRRFERETPGGRTA
jgi:hypothetical protein